MSASPPGVTLRVVQSVDPAVPVGLQLPVPEGGGVVGRAVDAQMCLAGNTVSRQHARLTVGTGGWRLAPLTTSNAVFLGGERVLEEVAIAPDQPFQLGGVVLTLVASVETTPVLEPLHQPALLEVEDDGGAVTVFSRGQLIPMAPASARVLGALAASAGHPVHRWDLEELAGASASLDKSVNGLRTALQTAIEGGIVDGDALREALGVDEADPKRLVRQLVVTRRGHGYLLALSPSRVRRTEV